MIAINVKINIHFNGFSFIKKNNKKVFDKKTRFFIPESNSNKLKNFKNWYFFFKFIKHSSVFNKLYLKKYMLNSKYILKKYYIYIFFIKMYLLKLFNSLKFVYILDDTSNKYNNILNSMLKLKFIIFYKFYNKFIKKFQLDKFKKINLIKFFKGRKRPSTKFRFYNNFVIKSFKSKLKKIERSTDLSLKLKKKIIFNNDDSDIFNKGNNNNNQYRQPISTFQYNPAYNPRHKITLMKRKLKKKKSYRYLHNRVNKTMQKNIFIKICNGINKALVLNKKNRGNR